MRVEDIDQGRREKLQAAMMLSPGSRGAGADGRKVMRMVMRMEMDGYVDVDGGGYGDTDQA